MIHCIGDSHVFVFSGNEGIPGPSDYRDLLPFFKTYHLGEQTACDLTDQTEIIEGIIEKEVGPEDSVMFCLGEIDCRVHLLKQSEMQGRRLRFVVNDCISRYLKVLEALKRYGAKTLVWNVIPSSINPGESGEYPAYGDCSTRTKVSQMFNKILRGRCEKRGMTFISIFDNLIDENGMARTEYYSDGVHLSQKAMPFILEELGRRMILVESKTEPLTVKPVEHYRQAQQFVSAGRISEALGEMKLALAEGATSVDAHYLYGQLLIATADYEGAVPVLNKVVTMMPWHTYALNDIAVIHLKRQEYDQAIEYYKKALSADNGNYSALNNLLSLLKELGRSDEAIDIAGRLIANDSRDEKVREIVKRYNLPLQEPQSYDHLKTSHSQQRSDKPGLSGKEPGCESSTERATDSKHNVADNTGSGYEQFLQDLGNFLKPRAEGREDSQA
jgi:tetratricopeptide (TPR) repeat protein